MVKRRTDSPRLEVLPADALAEDLLGLNLRGLRSVRVLWVHPRRYFAAAETLDWEGTYTPSIRLWLSFFALYSFMKVWWIGGNAGMIDAYASGFANAGMVLPEHVTFEQVGREAALFAFGLAPVLQIISMVVLSLIYPFWGRKTSLALRQRFLFATIIPSASLIAGVHDGDGIRTERLAYRIRYRASGGHAYPRFPDGLPRGVRQSVEILESLAGGPFGHNRRYTERGGQYHFANCGDNHHRAKVCNPRCGVGGGEGT